MADPATHAANPLLTPTAIRLGMVGAWAGLYSPSVIGEICISPPAPTIETPEATLALFEGGSTHRAGS
ncbi:MAG TPA: hypothetical protein VJQ54_22875 [Candidatus Sulfotelmatobacter sp.]|nr:hypothetical protein [Candidatus Sulfotelmatobacter sp.]